jgi:tRNA(Glu) U13 pseudouridine synthase TruD
MPQPAGAVAERERGVLERLGLPAGEAFQAPAGLRVRGGRRALRVPLGGLRVELEAEGRLRLRFELPPGSYATVALGELLGCEPESRVRRRFEATLHSEVSSQR